MHGDCPMSAEIDRSYLPGSDSVIANVLLAVFWLISAWFGVSAWLFSPSLSPLSGCSYPLSPC